MISRDSHLESLAANQSRAEKRPSPLTTSDLGQSELRKLKHPHDGVTTRKEHLQFDARQPIRAEKTRAPHLLNLAANQSRDGKKRPHLEAGQFGAHHGEVGLAASGGEGGADVLLALARHLHTYRIWKKQMNHGSKSLHKYSKTSDAYLLRKLHSEHD
jgi:hypothetical protein